MGRLLPLKVGRCLLVLLLQLLLALLQAGRRSGGGGSGHAQYAQDGCGAGRRAAKAARQQQPTFCRARKRACFSLHAERSIQRRRGFEGANNTAAVVRKQS